MASVDTSGVQINLFGGTTWTDINPAYIYLDGQTDTLAPVPSQEEQRNFTAGVGAAYRFVMPAVKQGQAYLLHDLSLGIDYFAFNTSQNGDVWEYQLQEYDGFTYHIPINSRRLMLDSEWTFHPIGKYLYPFLETGVGVARNAASYADTPIGGPESGQSLTMNENSLNQFAYTLGGGAKFFLTPKFDVSLRYLYTHLGNASPAKSGTDGLTVTAPLHIGLSTQSVLLGFTYLF
jgi:opacity protein-like surface antigen